MKIPKQEYTPEFRELAVKRVRAGQTIGTIAKELGLVEQTLRNWVKAAEAGKLNVASGRAVTPEQMELSRLRAENIRLKRECEILKKRQARSAVYEATANSVKYAWIAARQGEHGQDEMCAGSQRERLPVMDARGQATTTLR